MLFYDKCQEPISRLDQSDEFKHLNALFIFLIRWEDLDVDRKSFAFERMGPMISTNESFIRQIRHHWIEAFHDEILLKAILMGNRNLGAKIDKFF